MRRKRIAVLMASFEREYQQNFASGLAEASAGYGIDICIFNSRGHMDISMSTSEEQESMIYDLPDPEQFDGIISMPATMGSDTTLQKIYEFIASLKGKPHVSIDVRQENAVTIQFNDKVSVEELTEHMISRHGVTDIMYVSGPKNSAVANERINACRNVMRRFGLNDEESFSLTVSGHVRAAGRRRKPCSGDRKSFREPSYAAMTIWPWALSNI